MTYEAGDVLVTSFPFSDTHGSKPRPALLLSSARFNETGHSILAMITTAKTTKWHSDISIKDLDLAGLATSSVIRMKIFTLDNRLIKKRIGHIGKQQTAIADLLQQIFTF